jgi:hypothetical protein
MSNIIETQVERPKRQLIHRLCCGWLTLNWTIPSIPHPPPQVLIDYHINPIPPSSPIPQIFHQVTGYSIHSALNIIVEVA